MFSTYIPGHVDDKFCATDIEVDYKLRTFFVLVLVTQFVTACTKRCNCTLFLHTV